MSIMQDELEGLLLPERADPVALPQMEDWAALLRYFPKQVSGGDNASPISPAA